MVSLARVPCPRWFRRYLLDGDHWRAGKRVEGERARFRGVQLHAGHDEEQGSYMAYSQGFAEYLHRSLLDDVVSKNFRNAMANHRRVEDAMKELDGVLHEEVEALRYYLVPKRRRDLTVIQQADAMKMSTDALRDAAERGVVEVWEELGGIWWGAEP